MDLKFKCGEELDDHGMDMRPVVERKIFKHSSSGNTWTVLESDISYRARLEAIEEASRSGGPAFGEFQQAGECSIKTGGMTLRDYFAAKAMAAAIGVQESRGRANNQHDLDCLTAAAYGIADAMLAERAK